MSNVKSMKTAVVKQLEVRNLIEQIESMTDEEAYDAYGIEYLDDGVDPAVYDSIENLEYNSLVEWATAQIAATRTGTFEKRHSNKFVDDGS